MRPPAAGFAKAKEESSFSFATLAPARVREKRACLTSLVGMEMVADLRPVDEGLKRMTRDATPSGPIGSRLAVTREKVEDSVPSA